MTVNSSFLDTLEFAANKATQAENDFRRKSAARAKVLERERAFAYRRLNFVRAIADAVATAENSEMAVAAATVVTRTKLGWSSDSDARALVLSRLVPVVQQVFASVVSADEDDAPPADVVRCLTEFEIWYRDTHPNPFWILFEHYMPETPVVDF